MKIMKWSLSETQAAALLGLVGEVLLLVGIYRIHPPLCLILGGLVLLAAAAKLSAKLSAKKRGNP